MKFCWDNIENIRLSRNGNFRDIVKNITYYVEKCNNCGNILLKKSGDKGIYCSKECLTSSNKGKHHSEETKRKMSESSKGKHHTEETRKLMSEQRRCGNNSFYGKTHSEETRKLMSKIAKERFKNPKNSPFYGKTHTEETKRKMSENRSGNKCCSWKGGYSLKNIPTYDTYVIQLAWCESVRRNKEDQNILEVKCAYCGKWYIPTLYSVRNRLGVFVGSQVGEQRLYCSESCKQECPVYGQILWPKDFKQATSREVQPQLRQMVFERDNYECQKCGSTESLHCHHIEGIRWEPLESADIDMCITLCKHCHIEVHKKEGCGYNDMRCVN